MRKLAAVLVVLGAGVLAASPSFADPVKGENTVAIDEAASTKLPGGKTYTSTSNHQLCATADPKNPLNGASGNCAGGCLSDAAGQATCLGSCTWVDREGDMAFFTWDGQSSGGWKLAGGSGKWQGSTGEGTWKTTVLQAGNFTHNSWEGSVTMRK